MTQEYLTTGEFTRWTDQQDKKLDRILDHIENQALVNADTNTEIALLKSAHGKSRNINAGISSVVSAMVSGVVTALTSHAGK